MNHDNIYTFLKLNEIQYVMVEKTKFNFAKKSLVFCSPMQLNFRKFDQIQTFFRGKSHSNAQTKFYSQENLELGII